MTTRMTRRGAGCLVLALVLVLAGVVAGVSLFRSRGAVAPVAGQQRCVATAGGRSVALTLEQAHLTTVIVGLSVRRGLPARAASIAMTTAYQESGIRNLSGGDRDSVGLFQQRPSQGWGSVRQLQDPYYATGKFYDALVKVAGWQSDDINDVAQKVQRSGHPDAYRDHEADGRVLASALTGSSPAGLTCLERQREPGDATALVRSMEKTLGRVGHDSAAGTVTVRARSGRLAWAYGQHAVGNAARFGVTAVTVGDQSWTSDGLTLPSWQAAAQPLAAGQVRVTLR